MIYTCYEMVRDCRTDRPEGWAYFISEYVPLVRKLLAHYDPERAADGELNRVLQALRNPESSMFQLLEPAPERWFAAELRQKVLAELASPVPEIDIDLETVAAALEPLTVVEKQAAWFETMRYTPVETGPMVKMEPATVEKIRHKAAGLIRGKVDHWSQTMLAQNGSAVGRAAAAGKGKDCLPVKAFLDLIDGRTTWRGREEMEHHVNQCWHCVDHFCRMVEVVEQLRGLQPLSEAQGEPFRKLLGVAVKKPAGWKRIFTRA
jgi:hypothetical protein